MKFTVGFAALAASFEPTLIHGAPPPIAAGPVDAEAFYNAYDDLLAWKPRRNLEIAIVGQNLLGGHHPENGGSTLVPPIEVERGVYGTVTLTW